MEIKSQFEQGNELWLVSYSNKAPNYTIEGPFRIVTVPITVGETATEIRYTIDKMGKNGFEHVTEHMNIFHNMEKAYDYVKSDLEKKKAF